MPFPRPEGQPALPLRAAADAAGPDARLERDDAGETAVTGVSLATSTMRPGDLWAALQGAKAHGAQFAEQALAAGAAAVITDEAGVALLEEAGVALPRIVCPDPRARLGRVSAAVYGTSAPRLRLFGITGTNGKTTTAYLLDSALRALGHETGLIGTIETRVGPERITSVRTTPETTDLHALLKVMDERGVDDCVMEVSSHALELHRVDAVTYDVAIFTNLSQDHLDFHGTMDAYFAAKARLFTPEHSRVGVVCVDDAWGQRLAATATVPVTTVTSQAGVRADWHVGGDPAEHDFTLTPAPGTPGDGATLHLRSALPGDFNRVNTALAAVALVVAGHPEREVAGAVLTPPTVPGRMEIVEAAAAEAGPGAGPRVRGVVDYAHSPDAVAAALAALRPQTPGRLVAVLGAGGARDQGKRPGMGRAAAAHADVVVVTDDNPRDEDPAAIREAVAAGAGDGPAAVEVVPGREAAIRHAVALARAGGPGSLVALLGKGHEQGQEVAGVISPFDDRDELRAALRDEDGAAPVPPGTSTSSPPTTTDEGAPA